MKEIEEKKKKVASKMEAKWIKLKGETSKDKRIGRKDSRNIIESDFNRRELTEDKFGKKDFRKEKKERTDKDEMGKHDWEI